MATTQNSSLVLDANGFPRSLAQTDNISFNLDAGFSIVQDLNVGGDLTVQGDIVSGGTTDVVVSDNFIDLSNGNSVSKAGGLTVNVEAHTAVNMGAGTGVTFTAPATVSIDGYDPAALVQGDIIEISQLADLGENNGLFVVDSIVAGVPGSGAPNAGDIVIKVAQSANVPFAQTAFEAGHEDGGQLGLALDLAVMAISQGLLPSAGGTIPRGKFAVAYIGAATDANLIYEASESVDQQESYNAGAGITLLDIGQPGGQGDMIIVTDDAGARADFKVQMGAGANYLSTTANGIDLGSGGTTIAMIGQVSTDVVFDNALNRAISIDSKDLTVRTTTTGDLFMAAAQAASITATTGMVLTNAANMGGTNLTHITASNAGLNPTDIGEIRMDADVIGANSADTTSIISAGVLTLNGTKAGPAAVDIKASVGNLVLTGQVDASLSSATGAVTVTGGTTATMQSTGANAASLLSGVGGTAVISGLAGVLIDAAAGGFSIDAAGGPGNVTASGADLTVSAPNNDLVLASGAFLNMDGNTVALDSVSTTVITSGAAGTFTAAGLMTLSTTAAGNMAISSAGSVAASSVGLYGITSGTDYSVAATAGSVVITAAGAGKDAQLGSTNAAAMVFGQVNASVTAQTGDAMLLSVGAGAGDVAKVVSNGSDATAAVVIDATAGGLALTGQTQVHLESNAGDVIIESPNGSLTMEAGNSSSLAVSNASQTLTISALGAGSNLLLDSPNIHMDGWVELRSMTEGFGLQMQAGDSGITAGDVVCLDSSKAVPEVIKANGRGADSLARAIGVALTTAADGFNVQVSTIHGAPFQTIFTATNADIGKEIFLSSAAGALTLDPLADLGLAGDTILRIGYVHTGTANCQVIFAPQYIAKRMTDV